MQSLNTDCQSNEEISPCAQARMVQARRTVATGSDTESSTGDLTGKIFLLK